MGLLIFWGILFVIILLHELGHLLMAKKFGVRVKTYSIGFGPRIIGIKFYKGKTSIKVYKFKSTNEEIWSREDNTEYRLAPIPFGGFCSMAGELKSTGKDYELSSKPFMQKLIIALAGVGMNIITGFLTLFGIAIKNRGFIEGIKATCLMIYNIIRALGQAIYLLCTNQANIITASETNAIMSELGIEYILAYFGLFSIVMAIVNAIPFPALDGSLPFLWLIEKITGKKGSKVVTFLWVMGFTLLMVLQIIIFYFWIFG
jgi:membrane-associated protease RseP (regulator of RpoE activity)